MIPLRTHLWLSLSAILLLVGGTFLLQDRQGTTRISVERCAAEAPYRRAACLQPYFEDLTLTQSAARALDRAADLTATGVLEECHGVAHVIGNTAARASGFDIGKAFAECRVGCRDGCYHGVMEEYIGTVGRPADIGQAIATMCNQFRVADPPPENLLLPQILYRQCLHGIGHGLLAHKFLPLADAIATCQESYSETFEVNTCLGGVFMENVDQRLASSEQAFRRGLATACTEVVNGGDAKLTALCVAEIGKGIMDWTGYDLTRSERWCEALPYGRDTASICKKAARIEDDARRADEAFVERLRP